MSTRNGIALALRATAAAAKTLATKETTMFGLSALTKIAAPWAALCMIALTAACDYGLELYGNDTLAVGATESFMVVYTGAHDGLYAIHGASVADPTVVEVVEIYGSRITLKGLREGETTIALDTAVMGDDAFSDTVTVRVVQASRLSLTACGTSQPTLLAGSQFDLRYELFDNANQRLRGEGYYPWTLGPGEAVKESKQNTTPNQNRVTLADWDGVLIARSDFGDAALRAAVVRAGSLDGLLVASELAGTASSDDSRQPGLPAAIPADSRLYVDVTSTVQGTALCQAWPAHEVQSQTESICTVRASSQPPVYSSRNGIGVTVTAKSPGTCTFEVMLPGALNGNGLRQVYSLQIQ